jgi:hypothetical protein
MPDDPIATLERQLVDAARSRIEPDPVATATRRRGSLGALAAVVLSGAAVVVALGALVSLRGHAASSSAPRTPPATSIPGRQQLIDILAVLRRPQVPSDLNLHNLPFLSGGGLILALEGTPDLPLIRYATTTPWGEKVYFVPMKPVTAAELKAAIDRFHGPPKLVSRIRSRGETLGVYSGDGGGGGSTAASIEAGEGMEIDGAGRSFAGGSTQTRYILVVPDGVARVEFYFPAEAIPAGGPVYHHALAVTIPVRGNVAAVQVNRECCAGEPAVIWYGADGSVIKRIGGTTSPLVPPQPGPETSQSRAAEHNPATPNRIWLTASSGGPTTAVNVRFRLLLNDFDYRFRMTGPSHPGCQSSASMIEGGGIDDVRGRIYSGTLSPQDGRWCPGTYDVTVAAYDLGRAPGVLRHPPAPFGTATFTVIR